jgi:hypothetical protein
MFFQHFCMAKFKVHLDERREMAEHDFELDLEEQEKKNQKCNSSPFCRPKSTSFATVVTPITT